ncbi:MAG: prepilin-type N-terminal cleavage/methylation domain-containing protein [Verrucomicrobia bacterium]|nr:prepilin-type N-terminal cleavage/methylation domain-containing protein [Verrucomicrobiota bacterium]
MKAFTLFELLVSLVIVTVLAALIVPAVAAAKLAASQAISVHTLHQLLVGGNCYLADNDNFFWPYKQLLPDGTQWWFGFESWASMAQGEGNRTMDYSRGPLAGTMKSSSVLTDPVFLQYGPRLKPKYKNGNYGYGYNTELAADANGSPRNALDVQDSSKIVVFATCAQVNTFQSPASASRPMIEEFYMINRSQPTVHFRHNGKVAFAAFLDGSVRPLSMDHDMQPGSQDARMPQAHIGRLKTSYLKQNGW